MTRSLGVSLTSPCLSFLPLHPVFSLLFSCPRILWAVGLMPLRPSWVTLPSLTCGTTS